MSTTRIQIVNHFPMAIDTLPFKETGSARVPATMVFKAEAREQVRKKVFRYFQADLIAHTASPAREIPYSLDKKAIEVDLTSEKPQWILSAYGPGRYAPAQLF